MAEYLPDSQFEHIADSGAKEYFPGTHSVHSIAPLDEALPASHILHVVAPVIALYRPATHEAHDEDVEISL